MSENFMEHARKTAAFIYLKEKFGQVIGDENHTLSL